MSSTDVTYASPRSVDVSLCPGFMHHEGLNEE